MSAASTLTEAEVRDGLDALILEIDTVRMLLQRGTALDLAGMDQRVVTICEAAAGLPQDASARLLDRMETLVAQLEELAAALVRQQPGPGGDAGGRTHRRAADAYSKGSVDPE